MLLQPEPPLLVSVDFSRSDCGTFPPHAHANCDSIPFGLAEYIIQVRPRSHRACSDLLCAVTGRSEICIYEYGSSGWGISRGRRKFDPQSRHLCPDDLENRKSFVDGVRLIDKRPGVRCSIKCSRSGYHVEVNRTTPAFVYTVGPADCSETVGSVRTRRELMLHAETKCFVLSVSGLDSPGKGPASMVSQVRHVGFPGSLRGFGGSGGY